MRGRGKGLGGWGFRGWASHVGNFETPRPPALLTAGDTSLVLGYVRVYQASHRFVHVFDPVRPLLGVCDTVSLVIVRVVVLARRQEVGERQVPEPACVQVRDKA